MTPAPIPETPFPGKPEALLSPLDTDAPAPRVSVIIPHLNTPELLVICLQSLVHQNLDEGTFEIIVVDNGSKVPMDALKQAWPDVQFLLEAEAGPGPARNLGVSVARGRTLAFVDADVRVAPGWLQQVVDAVEADPSRPCGGEVRIDFKKPLEPTAIEAFEAVFSFRQKLYVERMRFSVTANMAVDKQLWLEVGPFAGIGKAEDRDWGHRAHAMGHSMRYVPQMLAFHPARPDMASVYGRWGRSIGHDFTKHKASGHPMLRWNLRALAVFLSAFAHTPKMLTSPLVPTWKAKVMGVKVLFATRWYRFKKMRSMAHEGHMETVMQWNRTS